MMKNLIFPSIKALYKNNNNIINLTTNSLTQICMISIQTMFILLQFSLILRNRKKACKKKNNTKRKKKGNKEKNILSIPVHKQENNNRKKQLREKQDKKTNKASSSLCNPVYHMHRD